VREYARLIEQYTQYTERDDVPERSVLLAVRFGLVALRSKYRNRDGGKLATAASPASEPRAREASGTAKRHRIAGPEPIPLDRYAATPDLRDAITAWQAWLADERRCSPHTVAAYGRDLAAFLDFLAGHLGATPSLAALEALAPADFRAYLLRRSNRLGRTSLARLMATLRSFFRFLAHRDLARNAAIALLRSPHLPRLVPKALTVQDAAAVLTAAAVETHHTPWRAKRDVALVTLLYGCGLRISEALALTRAEAPIEPGTLIVTGKGDNQRIVPVLPAVAEALRDYLAACPFRLAPTGPLFVGFYGSPLVARSVQKTMARLRAELAGDGDAARAATQLRNAPHGGWW
jgi:integrase/recombinase XerC